MRKGCRMLFAAMTGLMIAGFVPSVVSSYEGDAAFAMNAQSEDAQAMYRVYNPHTGEHFYTANMGERDSLMQGGWGYEGIGWMAPRTSDTPVYRLYSGTDHHYTISVDERDALVSAGWADEGIGWYSDDDETIPLYRQFNPNVNPNLRFDNSGSHNYTTNSAENDQLVQSGWQAEGVGWYAKATGSSDGSYDLPKPPISSDYAEWKIQNFFARFPEGTHWTNEDNQYVSEVTLGENNVFTHHTTGCAAYAFMLQDEIYRNRPYVYSEDPESVQPHDVVALYEGYSGHWAFVLSVDHECRRFVVAEGSYNDAVHIGRSISMDKIAEIVRR